MSQSTVVFQLYSNKDHPVQRMGDRRPDSFIRSCAWKGRPLSRQEASEHYLGRCPESVIKYWGMRSFGHYNASPECHIKDPKNPGRSTDNKGARKGYAGPSHFFGDHYQKEYLKRSDDGIS